MLIRRFFPLLGLGVAWSCAPPAPSSGATIPVVVDVQCPEQDVSFTVRPWHLVLNEGEEVRWDLAADGQTIEIRKGQSAWPFSTNKFNGNRANPPTSRAMKGGQKDKTFRYSIAVICQVNGVPRTVVLDPDMYIKK